MGSTLKGKNLLPLGANISFMSRLFFRNEAKIILTEFPQLKVSQIPLKTCLQKFSKNLVNSFLLTLCMLGNFACFFVISDFFFFLIKFFKQNLSAIQLECQTVWIQIRLNILWA